MEVENIILSEVSQAQKAKSHMLSLRWTVDLNKCSILWDIGHTKGTQGDRAREGNQKLECS
jgi:hypothetical protein